MGRNYSIYIEKEEKFYAVKIGKDNDSERDVWARVRWDNVEKIIFEIGPRKLLIY